MLSERTGRVFPLRIGSLAAGIFEGSDEAEVSSNFPPNSGEEMATFLSDGLGFGSERDNFRNGDVGSYEEDQLITVHNRPRMGFVAEILAADEKRSDLEYQLSQMEINLEKLQRIASLGLPDGGCLRATTWKILLGYLPVFRELWEKELTENRFKYAKLKEEHLLSPSQFKMRRQSTSSNEDHTDKVNEGMLMRHEISHDDHPLSLGKTSAWHRYFQDIDIAEQIDRDLQRTHPELEFFSGDLLASRKNREAMRCILLLFAKLNPAIRYVQGMNEVLAPIYYVFSTENTNRSASVNAEADSFFCFVRVLSESVDHFCERLDNGPLGIHSTLSHLLQVLKSNDEQLWHHLVFKTKVKPEFYAFRWITLLLTQEFDLHSIMRIWDSLLGNPFGIQEMVVRVCCAMLLCVKSRLLSGDFMANLKLLQHYPEVNLDHLLFIARNLTAHHPPSFPLFM